MLKPLLERHQECTCSSRAAQILPDWPAWKSRFKVLAPLSERETVGLAEREVVVW